MWGLIATVIGQELDIKAKRKKHDFSSAGRDQLYKDGIKAVMSQEYNSDTHRETSNMINATTKHYIVSKDKTKKILVPEGKTVAKFFDDWGYIDSYSTEEYAIFCNVEKLILQEVSVCSLELINYALSPEDR